MSVLVVGSSVADLTFYCEKIPAVGETVAGRFVQGLGGKGFNQAVASQLSGAKTSFLSAVGEDVSAEPFLKKAQALQINAQFEKIPGISTGAAAISVDKAGRNNIIVALGANARLSTGFLEKNRDAFAASKILLQQFETNLEVTEFALFTQKKINPSCLTILNPAPAIKDLSLKILEKVDLFTPNETELSEIAGMPTISEKEIVAACASIHGPKAILATLGEKGCCYYARGEAKFFRAFQVKALDTSGAGDAFNGGLASGLLRENGNIEKAIYFAMAVAALSVTKPGTSASMPAKEEVEAFLRAK